MEGIKIFEHWVQFVILMCSLIGGVFVVVIYLKKVATKELRTHIKEQAATCTVHKKDLIIMKETNRIMLECHDATLQALDSIAHGRTVNGEITKQRERLKKHMLDQFFKEVNL